MTNTAVLSDKPWKYRSYQEKPLSNLLTSELTERSPKTPEHLTNIIKDVCQKILSRPRPTRKPNPWWSPKLTELRKDLLQNKRRLTRSNKRCNGSPNLEILRQYKQAYQNLREEIKISKERMHERLCDELDQNPWGDAYRLAIGKLKPRKPCEVPENPDYIVKKLFPEHPPVSFTESSSEGITAFEVWEIQYAAKKLRKGKSTGPDGIPAEVIQIIAKNCPEALKTVMNSLLKKGEFPALWKHAELRLIPKEGHSKESPKYRPICLLNSLAKLMEHLIKRRLTEELVRTNGISRRQHAYQEGRSTTSAIKGTVEFMEKTYKRGPGWTPAVILLDVLNAFNSASWQLILERLRKLGIKPYLVKIISSYLSERILTLGDKTYILTSGVPQGSVLGPTLWNVVFDEVLNIEMPDFCEATGYADDLALKIAAKNDRDMRLRGNLAMKRVQDWMHKNQMRLAVEKTNALIARGRRTAVTRAVFFEINGHKVQPAKTVKYLGVWLDENLNFQAHAATVSQEATKAYNCLAAILSKTNVRMAKRRIIASVVEAKLLYGCEVWLTRMPGCAFKILESVQRKAAIRVIQGYPTISTDAALVLAGMVPIRIKAESRYNKSENGRKIAQEQTLMKWQRRWEAADTGAWTRRLIPNVKTWIDRRHGELSYHITQFLSGHGGFGSYLKRMNRVTDSGCKRCKRPETAEHLLFDCEGLETERQQCRTVTKVNLRPESMVACMSLSVSNWTAVESFVTSIFKDN